MLTKIDINKLKEAFVTKDEFKDLKNDIVTFKDEILHEIIKLRDDIFISPTRSGDFCTKQAVT